MSREQIEEDIYNSLKAIEDEEQVKLHDKAFITDFLSGKLVELGYERLEGKTNSTGTLCLGANRGEPKENDNKSF